MPDLLTRCNDYLVAQSIVRDPRVAGSAPPLWPEPRDGVPAPGEGTNATEKGQNVVVGVFFAGSISTGRHNKFRRIDFLEFWIRVRTPDLIWPFDASLRAALHDKRGWDMAGQYVAESLVYLALRRHGADEQGWTYSTQFSFQTLIQ